MVDTPLSRYMRHIKLSRRELARRIGIDESNVSRLVSKGASKDAAREVIAALGDAAALGFDERHILYPTVEPYASWAPPAAPQPATASA